MNNQPMLATPIQAVIFDLGGVILRTDDQEPRRLLAERFGRTYSELDEIVFGNPEAQKAERGLVSPEQVWAEIGRILQTSPEETALVRKEFFAGDRVDLELIGLIDQIHAVYPTALLSNTWIKDLEYFVLSELKIPPVFDSFFSSAQLGTAKPDAEIFHLTMQTLGVQPQESVFVDDNLENIKAANQLGIRAIRFLNFEQVRQDLLKFIQIPGTHPFIKPQHNSQSE